MGRVKSDYRIWILDSLGEFKPRKVPERVPVTNFFLVCTVNSAISQDLVLNPRPEDVNNFVTFSFYFYLYLIPNSQDSVIIISVIEFLFYN